MKPNEIMAALMLNNKRPSEIARKLNVTRGIVSNVIHNRTYSRRIREEIAREIGKPVEEIWPHGVAGSISGNVRTLMGERGSRT